MSAIHSRSWTVDFGTASSATFWRVQPSIFCHSKILMTPTNHYYTPILLTISRHSSKSHSLTTSRHRRDSMTHGIATKLFLWLNSKVNSLQRNWGAVLFKCYISNKSIKSSNAVDSPSTICHRVSKTLHVKEAFSLPITRKIH